jgi:hypothetical protein
MWASMRGRAVTVRALIEAGADLNLRNRVRVVRLRILASCYCERKCDHRLGVCVCEQKIWFVVHNVQLVSSCAGCCIERDCYDIAVLLN